MGSGAFVSCVVVQIYKIGQMYTNWPGVHVKFFFLNEILRGKRASFYTRHKHERRKKETKKKSSNPHKWGNNKQKKHLIISPGTS